MAVTVSSTPQVFEVIGRTLQLRIRSADDLRGILDLEEAHWVALSAPVSCFSVDPVLLGLLDRDADGRIRCDDIRAAITWLLGVVHDDRALEDADEHLHLDRVDTAHPDGMTMVQAVRRILRRVGLPDSDTVSLAQVRQVRYEAERSAVSEAGVVLPEAAESEEMRQFLADVVAVTGGAPHPKGVPGVNAPQLDRFLAETRAWLDWEARGHAAEQDPVLHPLGADTASAHETMSQLTPKIDQYFAQCRALSFDPGAIPPSGPALRAFEGVDSRDPAALEAALRDAPPAPVGPSGTLDFSGPLNPAYRDRLLVLREQVVAPLLGEETTHLDAESWKSLKARFAPYRQWLEARPATAASGLDRERLTAYLDSRFADAARDLIGRSMETAIVLEHIRLVEKALVFQKWLLAFANNFVSFPYLYDPHSTAMFERGTLVMDGRRFSLGVRVDDRTEHAKLAASSNIYVLYAELTRKDAPAGTVVAVPVTYLGRGNLGPGKRGIFIDTDGGLWDARVVQVIENPISLREAFVAPFQRLGRMLTGRIETWTASAEKRLDSAAGDAVTAVQGSVDRSADSMSNRTATAPVPAPVPAAAAGPPPVQREGRSVPGMLAGGGIAVAAMGSSLAFITKTLAGVKLHQILIVILAALLAVTVPTLLVAWGKLRRRDLSAVLEGCGWAINTRMRLSRVQSRTFTQRPPYPLRVTPTGRLTWWLLGILAITAIAAAIVWARLLLG